MNLLCEIDPINTAWNSILSTGVVGAVAVLAITALWVIMNRRDTEHVKAREEDKVLRIELLAALAKKDDKLQTVMETGMANSTTAMLGCATATNSMAEAIKENTQVLRGLQCAQKNG